MMLKDLLEIQRKFDERVDYKASMREYLLAIRTEMFELYNSVECGKWWKLQKGKGIYAILDECADVMAFIFSCKNTHFPKNISIFSLDYHIHFKEVYNSRICFEDCLLNEFSYFGFDVVSLWDLLNLTIQFTIGETGCSLEDIRIAYLNKMEVNHTRQDNSY